MDDQLKKKLFNTFFNAKIQHFFSKCNALKFYIKYKQIYFLKDPLEMKKIIKIILQQFGSTMGKSVVSQ